MKKKEMLEELGYLKTFCKRAGEMDGEPEVWNDSEHALSMAIELIGDGYIDDVAYIKDLVNFIFIFLGLIALLMLIIVCQI